MSAWKNMVVCLGDSATAGSFCPVAYPELLERKLGPAWTCANLGHAGDFASAVSGSSCMFNMYFNVAKGRYTKQSTSQRRVLVMMGGFNDCGLGLGGSASLATCQGYATNAINALQSIYSDAIAQSSPFAWDMVILLTDIPANGYLTGIMGTAGQTNGATVLEAYEWNAGSVSGTFVGQLQALAGTVAGLTVLDTNTLLSSSNTASFPHTLSTGTNITGTYGQASTKPDYALQANSSNFSSSLGATDYLHPNMLGHDAIATLVANTIIGAGL